MADPTSIPAPNYTQTPNVIFDLMADKDAHLTEAELRVILVIARKTFGWHKKRDKISLSQLEQLTAMSRTSVIAGLDAAIARGLVRKTPDRNDKRGGFFYELVVEEPNDRTSTKSELVQNLDQSSKLTRTSTKSELELVQNLDPQKKDKEKKEREREVGDSQQAPPHSPFVLAYFSTYPNETLSADQIEEINRRVTDLKRWKRALHYWSTNGHRARSIGKICDRYDEEAAGRNGHERGPPIPVQPWKPPEDALSGQALKDAIAARTKKRE